MVWSGLSIDVYLCIVKGHVYSHSLVFVLNVSSLKKGDSDDDDVNWTYLFGVGFFVVGFLIGGGI